tara:strand:+ start:1197 stop:1808 length:612 start_codon:yes stop_codon:yes gene_type:complete
MAGLNKKILCFVDEYGTAGEPGFALGCVMVWARECGKVDKAFSDLLPSSVNEVHAVNWKNNSLQGLLGKFSQTDAPGSLLMLNKRADVAAEERPVLYARAMIETVKIGVRRFARSQGIVNTVGNVEVITDANDQNAHPLFDQVIQDARLNDGRFKAVTRVVPLDSAASRVLQLADVVAHTRAWIDNAEFNAKGLSEAYNIEIL